MGDPNCPPRSQHQYTSQSYLLALVHVVRAARRLVLSRGPAGQQLLGAHDGGLCGGLFALFLDDVPDEEEAGGGEREVQGEVRVCGGGRGPRRGGFEGEG